MSPSGAGSPAPGSGAGHVVLVGPVDGFDARMRVPGDKSISHRALMFNALADGHAEVQGLAPGADVGSTMAALRALGVDVEPTGPQDARICGGAPWAADDPVDCRNAGTTARLLLGALAPRAAGPVTLTGDGSLSGRPMGRVVAPLRAMGARIEGGDQLPLTVEGRRLVGREHRLGVASAQVSTALLLAGLAADGPTTVVEPARSRDHTERLLAAMGADVERDGLALSVRPGRLHAVDVDVPGDLSAAAPFLALAAAIPGALIVVEDVGLNPTRTGFLDILEAFGADVRATVVRTDPEPRGTLAVAGRPLRAVSLGGELVPRAIDELPLVAVLATRARGTTRVAGAAELRVKESDRVATIAAGLGALGAAIRPRSDGFEVDGPRRLTGSRLDAAGDHRIGMALAVAALLAKGDSELAGAQWIDVSFPGFLERLLALVGAEAPA